MMSDKFRKPVIPLDFLSGVRWNGSEVAIEFECADEPCNPSIFVVFPDGSAESGSRFEHVGVFDSSEARDKFSKALNAVIARFVAEAIRKENEPD